MKKLTFALALSALVFSAQFSNAATVQDFPTKVNQCQRAGDASVLGKVTVFYFHLQTGMQTKIECDAKNACSVNDSPAMTIQKALALLEKVCAPYK